MAARIIVDFGTVVDHMPFKGFVESEGCRLIILIGAARNLERGLQRESFKVFVGPSHHLEWK